MEVRKADSSGGALNWVEMTNEHGQTVKQGPQGVPGSVHVTDPPSGGVVVQIRDSNGSVFFNETVSDETPFGLDDMAADLVDGPLYVHTAAACGFVFIYTK